MYEIVICWYGPNGPDADIMSTSNKELAHKLYTVATNMPEMGTVILYKDKTKRLRAYTRDGGEEVYADELY